MSPAILIAMVVGVTLVGAALGGIVTAVVFAVVASATAAMIQIRGLRPPQP